MVTHMGRRMFLGRPRSATAPSLRAGPSASNLLGPYVYAYIIEPRATKFTIVTRPEQRHVFRLMMSLQPKGVEHLDPKVCVAP